jgi:large subunit ribosomal protein L22
MDVKSTAKTVRYTPRKVRLVLDLIRGKSVNEALAILKFTPGKGSAIVEKVVSSAAANAENNFDMNPDNLYVAEVYANQGPTMKRWRAGSQGRASIILKRTSHVGVTLKEKE